MLLQKRIFDWSKKLPDWQSDLLRRRVAGPLSDKDRAEVRDLLNGVPGAPPAQPLKLADLPADENTHGRVELRSLGSFSNINRLASGQTLVFKPGLNVVYGGNGTGKTGHGRLLRGVCRAAERETVLPNVFEATQAGKPQTARIEISVDGGPPEIVDIDLAVTPDHRLSAIWAFDAACSRVCLTKPNVIDYVPESLLILKLLAEEQDAIAELQRQDIATQTAKLPVLPELDPDTEAGAAVAALNASSDPKDLERIATLAEAELAELDQLEVAVAAIRADNSAELERAARARSRAVLAAAARIRDLDGLDQASLERLVELRAKLDATLAAERKLAEEAFAASPFKGAGDQGWREMWESAVRYVEAGGGTFPSEDPNAVCPTCEQPLGEEARRRLTTLDEFVKSDLRRQATELEVELRRAVAALPDPATLAAVVEANVREAPEPVGAAARDACSVVSDLVEHARRLASGADSKGTALAIDLTPLDVYAAEETKLADQQAALQNPHQQRDVNERLRQLQARKTLAAHLPKLKQRITALKKIAALQAGLGQLGTTGLSVQLRKLQEAEVTERLRTAIGEEINHMTIAGKVELTSQASKGETLIQLRLVNAGQHKVGGVLSTGEQTAVGTAFFLAELAVSAGESAIVFDDPVSSLDHDNREYLAERLVAESKKRQVIVYTHDITFLVHLQGEAEAEDVDMHCQTLESTQDEAGIVRDGLPTYLMAPAKRRKDLAVRLKTELRPLYRGGKSAEYERAADTWVSDLRKGYDQLIEHYVLAGTVRRFNSHVRVRHLHMVTWTPEIATEIEAAMKKLSPKAHYEAPEMYPRAHTLDELSDFLDEFEDICQKTVPKSEKIGKGKAQKPTDPEADPPDLDDELNAQAQASLFQAS